MTLRFLKFFESKGELVLRLITLLIISTSLLSRLLFNGMVFDFDYHIYQPDGALYTFMALRYLGFSKLEAARNVIDWYAIHAEPGTVLPIEFFNAEEGTGAWSLVSTRVVYPILSAPFVEVFGIPGMMVVPILSYLIFLALLYRIGLLIGNPNGAAIIIFLLTLSPTISRWYVANITDGLLATIFSLVIFVLLRQDQNKAIFSLVGLIVISSFVRFSAPYWYALAIFFLLKKSRALAGIVFFTSTLCVIPTLLARPSMGSIVAGVDGGVQEKILYFPISALQVLFIEVAQLAALDRSLLFILVVALILSIIEFKRASSQLFLLMVLAGWFIGALNGVLGVNFRYQLPIVIFAAWTILEKINITANWAGGNVLNIVRNKIN